MSTTSPEPLPETPDLRGAYPRLNDEQLEALAARGERRPTSPGQVLYREGDEGYEFFAILEGKVAAGPYARRGRRRVGGAPPRAGRPGPGTRRPGAAAYLIRRSILIELGIGLRIIGSRFPTRRLLEFAARNLVPHRWIDLEHDKEAEMLVSQLGVKPEETPVVIWGERGPSQPEHCGAGPQHRPARPELWADLV